ncbi:MAG: cell division protein ZapB [Deltaproteobacteria bacterium]|nr:cell division protein ZapB [Deltaproteobacteria bacterium]
MDWLDTLEERVREAAAEIERLREENVSLSARLAELEEQLQSAQAEGDSEGWEEERQAIRQRVEKLASSLESLLED